MPPLRAAFLAAERVGGREPEPNAGGDDECPVGHACDQEEQRLQGVLELRLPRRAFEELRPDDADADARAHRGNADEEGHSEGKDVEAVHDALSLALRCWPVAAGTTPV